MKILKYATVPVCVIIITIVMGVRQNNLSKPNIEQNIYNKEWKLKEIFIDESNLTAEDNLGTILKWEERTITQKFYTVRYLDEQYDNSRNTKISSDKIGKKIDVVTLDGYDEYTKTVHSINASLYELKDFPKKCVIAVQFEGDNNYYVYINAYYRPETLGDLVKDLKLKETLSFGTIYYGYGYTNSKGERKYERVEFYDVDNDIIWKMLFNDLNLKNIYNDNSTYKNEYLTQEMSISVDIPLFGIKNISVSLTDKGYLLTNIFETGKGFYIGENKVKEFINYIIQNYDGYKIVYVDENDSESTNKGNEIENVTKDTIIVTKNMENGYITEEIITKPNVTNENKTDSYIPNN